MRKSLAGQSCVKVSPQENLCAGPTNWDKSEIYVSLHSLGGVHNRFLLWSTPLRIKANIDFRFLSLPWSYTQVLLNKTDIYKPFSHILASATQVLKYFSDRTLSSWDMGFFQGSPNFCSLRANDSSNRELLFIGRQVEPHFVRAPWRPPDVFQSKRLMRAP